MEISEYCREHRSSNAEPDEWFQNLSLMMLSFAACTFDKLSRLQLCPVESQTQYACWLNSRLDEYLNSAGPGASLDLLNSARLENLCQRFLADSKRGNLSARTGEQLFNILIGEVDALDFIFEDEAFVGEYYHEVNQTGKAFDMLSAYLDAKAHRDPELKYLEIGAGTGATTDEVLGTIARPEVAPRYSEFYYTDISPYFISHATEKYARYPRMKYSVLNIGEDPLDQGFDEEGYDIIIAANVLHATKNLGETLANTRKLLKPNGQLIMMEMTTPLKIHTGFVFGLLPGWWLSSEEYRRDGAVIAEEQWHSILKQHGFSGSDHIFRDWESDYCHGWSIIVTSKTTPDAPVLENGLRNKYRMLTFVVDMKSSMQRQVGQCLQRDFEYAGVATDLMSLEGLYLSSDLSERDVVLLCGLDECLLYEMQEPVFQALQKILTSSRSVIWVNNTGLAHDGAPYWAMTDGLARVCRNVDLSISVATLALEWSTCEDLEKAVGRIAKFIHEIHKDSPTETMDLEWMEVKEWIEDDAAYTNLEPDDIEVRIQAIGVNFKECLTLLGRINTDRLGSEAAGYVHRIGANVQNFKVGDRVVVGTPDSYQTFVRVKEAVRLPDTISFVEAASIPTAFCTAYVSLIRTARLQKGETILIHAAAGGTGQAAVQLAQNIGADVFVTVGSQAKKKPVIEQYNIPEDHIFYSHDSSFADGIKRMTKGRGVDVILNSLSGKLLVASWESIAPFGRFVEIGRKDIDTRGHLPIYPLIKNASFAGVDLGAYIVGEAAKKGTEQLQEVFQMLKDKVIRPPYPLSKYPISQAEDAFRLLQSGKGSGKIVLEISDEAVIPIRESANGEYRFRADATYIVAGAFGGIGRQITRWMAHRGAQNLLLLSRSTLDQNTEARRMISKLKALGVYVRHASCDISELTSLDCALQTAMKTMPPIKGCFQAAMVLNDRPFSTMQYTKWNATIRPKVQGSWNLHKTLPNQMDFFVMLSSVTGIVGNPGQSNYAAGNTFQDALARYRVARGEKATALDLGIILGGGFVAENKDIYDRLGVEVPLALQRSLFRAIHQVDFTQGGSNAMVSSSQDIVTLFQQSASLQEARSIVAEALKVKVSRLLGIDVEGRTVGDRMQSFGIDSLVALELRNWISKELRADIAVFEILGDAKLSDIGKTVSVSMM
ncbi:uncharacterized protein BP5553_03397 [Venustampulla echinocandica]|uniref:Carrier domain-containing protein n=1 Tax=Venustampulla echinocandica TaxID=2656787 RepID=A0A370TU48_9HELO|nr:uncharacterized protein BP5553_03397 [Venustampulla echinocandica]RDL39057.1 hypothetical protein BP5553_03397 [Venustampulla echinocandica]